MSKKVVVAVDGSKTAEKAATWYLDSVARSTDDITFAYVSEPAFPAFELYWTGVAPTAEALKEKEHQIQARMKEIEKKYTELCTNKGFSCGFVHEQGLKPGENICKLAEQHGANMIVMGSRGLGTLRRTILGSVSDYVLHHTHVPVSIIKKDKK